MDTSSHGAGEGDGFDIGSLGGIGLEALYESEQFGDVLLQLLWAKGDATDGGMYDAVGVNTKALSACFDLFDGFGDIGGDGT